jgi:AraC-like DNA-binding protein
MLDRNLLGRLCAARDLLRAETDRLVSVREVAREAGMSPFHFIRIFKAVFGATPYQYQLRGRLERAKVLLATSDAAVTDICLEVGFSSLGSFSASFHRRVGVPPSAYRKRVRPLVRVPGDLPQSLIPGCFSLMGADFA